MQSFMKGVYSKQYEALKPAVEKLIEHFNTEGVFLYNGGRNMVKYFPLGDLTVNIKSFKVPNAFNKWVYRYIRKSKARRSFEYAQTLLQHGIGTPAPIAYFEIRGWLGITSSFYCSKHLSKSFTLREVIDGDDYPDAENIIRHYTRLMYLMHEKQIYFKDNSAGNFLIEKEGQNYHFYLVDLNRMAFGKKMNVEQRLENFSRMASNDMVTKIINDEYALLLGKPASATMQIIEQKTAAFWKSIEKKRAFKARWKRLIALFKRT